MIERLIEFWPSLAVLAGIAAIGTLYNRVILPMILGRENYKNKAWLKNWTENHKMKASIFIGLPALLAIGPAIEELVFRAPLVVLFNQISGYAWPAIIFFGALFGLTHYFGQTSRETSEAVKSFLEKKAGDTEINEASKRKTIQALRITRTITFSAAGIVIGYLGIKYQSLWLCWGIHAGLNLIMPALIAILLMLLFLIGGIALIAGYRIKWWLMWHIKYKLLGRSIFKEY